MTSGKSGQSIYQFDEFQLNAGSRLLLRDGQALSLTPRVFDTLVYLVKHHGRVIEKDELMREIWRVARSLWWRSSETPDSREDWRSKG